LPPSSRAKPVSQQRSPRQKVDPSRCRGAREGAIPDRIDAELATLEDAAPEGDAWLHEIRFDGYRILAHIADGRAGLISRNHLDWTHRFRRIAEALPAVADQAILDGEIVALDERGASNFGTLQQALSGAGATANLVYMVFDLIYLSGYDLRPCCLEDRKALLAELLGPPGTAAVAERRCVVASLLLAVGAWGSVEAKPLI
jgi:bifunctional non-homologous end joining protein LigD